VGGADRGERLDGVAMTTKQIEAKMAEENKRTAAKFETAKRIRELLDEARKVYGVEEWDDNGVQDEVLSLVTEEE
jgi:hypothetical protein